MRSRFEGRTPSQRQASDPEASIWVSAHAGSGKTSVLVDRILKLLLAGVKLEKILCITYTNSAVEEIRGRIVKILSDWCSCEQNALEQDLEALEMYSPENVEHARQLFYIVLENFHNMKVRTMHSFCYSLIQKFPIECDAPPNFQILEEASAEYKIECFREAFNHFDYKTLSLIFCDLQKLDKFLEEMTSKRSLIRKYLDEKNEKLVLEKDWRDLIVNHWQSLGDFSSAGLNSRNKTNWEEIWGKISQYLNKSSNGTVEMEGIWDSYRNFFLTGRGSVRKVFYKDEVLRVHGLEVEGLADKIRKCQRMQARVAFLSFAQKFLELYQNKKTSQGFLDNADLIEKAEVLLGGFGNQWVGYRMDGAVDHILVDEAQDISMDQWSIIDSLVEEFFSQKTDRTLMVVGDPKQSIYGFQGGGNFEDQKRKMIEKYPLLADPEQGLQNLVFDCSFRLPTMVLDLVNGLTKSDHKFMAPLASDSPHVGKKFLGTPEMTENRGRVEVWEAASQGDSKEKNDYMVAEAVAKKIQLLLGKPYSEIGGPADSVIKRGDFLILFQKRNDLFNALEKALSKQGLTFVSSSKKEHDEEPFIQSILLVMKAALNPRDDLALASFLVGVEKMTVNEVESVCLDRGDETVWEVFQRTHPALSRKVEEMHRDAHRLPPYQFFYKWVFKFENLKMELKLFDEFLNICKGYREVPSRSNAEFLEWFSKIPKKRIRLREDNKIQLMTIHNAKGLEAPIVFLPDCCQNTSFSMQNNGKVVYGQRYPLVPGLDREKDPEWKLEEDKAMKERSRLLYVAVTRTQCALYCAGAEGKKSENTWHNFIQEAVRKSENCREEGENLVLS